jgi:hypothetical protein
MLPPRNEQGQIEGPGLLTACVPQSAAVRDNEALPEVLEQQRAAGLLPEQMTADTIYGSDANVQWCARLGVRLLSPVGGVEPKTEKEPRHWCSKAERERKARLAQRRAEEETPEWRREYAQRSGIEGVNRALDATTGLKQLRVRGTRAVTVAVSLKATGWNIMAAAKIRAHRNRKARRQAVQPHPRRVGAQFRRNLRPRRAIGHDNPRSILHRRRSR